MNEQGMSGSLFVRERFIRPKPRVLSWTALALAKLPHRSASHLFPTPPHDMRTNFRSGGWRARGAQRWWCRRGAKPNFDASLFEQSSVTRETELCCVAFK